MKNKKLFAILTLVCFMFTLMPVAAFAADDFYVVANDAKDKDTITVETEESFEVSVYNGAVESAAEYYFWAEDNDGKVVALETTSGTAVDMDFDAVGTYYVYAVTGVDLSTKVISDTKGEIVEWVKDMHDDKIVDECLTVKVKAADNDYTLSVVPAAGVTFNPATNTLNIGSNNGWDEDGELAVYLNKTVGGDAVKGEKLSISTSSPYISVDVDDEYTNRNGKVELVVSATKSGTYKLYVNHADADRLAITVKVGVGDVKDIKTVVEPKGSVALDTAFSGTFGYSGVAFDLISLDGAILDNTDVSWTEANAGVDYKITVNAPADSNLDADDLYLTYDSFTNKAWTLKAKAGKAPSFDEEGKYVITVAFENGASATATVNVAEFGEPVRMMLTLFENTVGIDEVVNNTVAVKSITYLDAKGVTLSTGHADFNNYGVVAYAANGKAVADVNEETGLVTIVTDDEDGKLIGTAITVYAINDELEMTATANITIVDSVEGLVFQDKDADVAVTNKLIVNTVDANGDVVSANLSVATTTVSAYVLSAPANAVYGVDANVTDTDEVTVEFTASVAGEYKVQLIVREDGKYYSTTETIVVGGTAGQFKDVVVMSIGANNIVVNSDVKAITAAPMIQDNRTFVPFRALAEAFGADVEWVEATQSVVAELNGVKVVMNIGENAYTVNGAAKTADVAPFINGASTMVPVRFVAEAFGINVTPIYAENGAVADVLFAK